MRTKFIIIISLLSVFSRGKIFAQTSITPERYLELINQSKCVIIPQAYTSRIQAFKELNKNKELVIEKNLIFIKTILNEAISPEERIWVCNHLIQNYASYPDSMPLEIVSIVKESLIK